MLSNSYRAFKEYQEQEEELPRASFFLPVILHQEFHLEELIPCF